MYGNSTRENRETPAVLVTEQVASREAKAMCRTADMNAAGESDGCVVPTKGPNNGELVSPAEGLEGRRPTKENVGQHDPVPDSAPDMGGSLGLLGVREACDDSAFFLRRALDATHPR